MHCGRKFNHCRRWEFCRYNSQKRGNIKLIHSSDNDSHLIGHSVHGCLVHFVSLRYARHCALLFIPQRAKHCKQHPTTTANSLLFVFNGLRDKQNFVCFLCRFFMWRGRFWALRVRFWANSTGTRKSVPQGFRGFSFRVFVFERGTVRIALARFGIHGSNARRIFVSLFIEALRDAWLYVRCALRSLPQFQNHRSDPPPLKFFSQNNLTPPPSLGAHHPLSHFKKDLPFSCMSLEVFCRFTISVNQQSIQILAGCLIAFHRAMRLWTFLQRYF